MHVPEWMEEQESNADVTEFSERLQSAIRRYNRLNEPVNHTVVQHIVDYLGEYCSVATVEAVLKYYKAKRDQIVNSEIPEIMQTAGVDKLSLEDGTEISLGEKINVKVKDESAFFDWLVQEGYGDVIKDIIEFGKGDFDSQASEWLAENGYSFRLATKVHPQTRDKVIRDRMEDGKALPSEDVVEVSPFRYAKIKENK